MLRYSTSAECLIITSAFHTVIPDMDQFARYNYIIMGSYFTVYLAVAVARPDDSVTKRGSGNIGNVPSETESMVLVVTRLVVLVVCSHAACLSFKLEFRNLA